MVGFLHQVSTLSLVVSLLTPGLTAEFLLELLQEQGPHIPQNPWWAVVLILPSEISHQFHSKSKCPNLILDSGRLS